MDTSHDLELLILSRYPLIALETFEERRAEQVLQHITTKLSIPFYVWTLADGLRQVGTGNPVTETKTPVRAINSIGSSRAKECIFSKTFTAS